MEEKPLESKAIYRLIKVVYCFLILCIVLLFTAEIVINHPKEVPNYILLNNSFIQCLNNKSYPLSQAGIGMEDLYGANNYNQGNTSIVTNDGIFKANYLCEKGEGFPSGMIRVRKLSTGEIGMMPKENFTEQKYEILSESTPVTPSFTTNISFLDVSLHYYLDYYIPMIIIPIVAVFIITLLKESLLYIIYGKKLFKYSKNQPELVK